MQRLHEIKFGTKGFLLPCFFPSVSSVKTNLSIADYVELLMGIGFPNFLISAYDYEHATEVERHKIAEHLKRAELNDTVILLDSGNYESFWLRDSSWSATDFQEVCRKLKPTFAFSFDDQNPPNDSQLAAEIAVKRAKLDSQSVPNQIIIPIVHSHSALLPMAVANAVRELRPPMVAIPERELGDGITERCRTIASLRSRLNDLDYYCPIHVLGTGNPYSLFAFALSGADSFDGLEWCQTVVDFTTGQLSHFQHWALFASNSPLAKTEGLPYQQRTLAHNLVFWAELMLSLRQFIRNGTSTALTDGILARVRPVLPMHIP
jgi:queuine/archaeosine tRNA-ribosyltransferase